MKLIVKNKKLRIFIAFVLTYIFFNTNYWAEEKVKQPKIPSQSAVLIDAESNRILFEKNSQEVRPMASTTKIMTCLVALENASLDDEVIISKKAAATPAVKLHLKAGEKHRLGDLLYALMLISANDSAVAIAEHVSGSVDKFCEKMTERAHEIGAVNTTFKTPNGLDAEDHETTARDLALITKYAFQNPKFAQIINTKEKDIMELSKNYLKSTVVNKNRLLREFEGANGVKTGFTGKAGHCFVGSAVRNNMHIISVVLASGWGNKGKEQKWIDTKALLKYGFENFKREKVIYKRQIVFRNVPIEKGVVKSLNLYSNNDVYLPLREGELEKLKYQLFLPNKLIAPIYQNQKIGVAKIFIGEEYINEISLIADRNINRVSFKNSFYKIMDKLLEVYSQNS